MRRTILNAALAAVIGALHLAGQTAQQHGNPAPDAIPRTHGRSAPAVSAAQNSPQTVFDATKLGSPVMLDKGWRVGITTNSSASQPAFDDSKWAIRDAKSTMSDVSDDGDAGGKGPAPNFKGADLDNGLRRFAWFRLHIKLAPGHGPLSLLIEVPVSQNTSLGISSTGPVEDVFANGKSIRPEGPHGNAPQHYQLISRIYNLKIDPAETSLTLAIRTPYFPFGYNAYTSFFANRRLEIGDPADLGRTLELWSTNNLFERLPRLVDSVLLAVLAFFLFALYFAQKGHIEYLWLALHELLQAPFGFVELAGSFAPRQPLVRGDRSGIAPYLSLCLLRVPDCVCGIAPQEAVRPMVH